MITKRNGNGQTECYGCKEKGKFALTWDSWLYNYNNEPYCFNCLMEELERLNKENKKLKNKMSSVKFYTYRPIPGQELKAFYGACEHIDYLQENLYNLLKQKQELINYLKSEDTDLKENVVNLEEKLRNTSRDSFYYNSYLKTLHRFRAKRELIKEILSKIEKSDK